MDLRKHPTSGADEAAGTADAVGNVEGFDPDAALGALAAAAPERLRHVERLPAREPTHAELPEWIDPGLAMALRGSGVDRLWAHQLAAAEIAHAGRHVVLATGTASGKSLGYLVPGLSAVAEGSRGPNGRGATLLYISPTKALAADQLARIGAMAVPGVRPATYDGDTAPEERRWIRDHANVVLTNPDLLHHALLPRHEQWASFLRALQYVVLDECHAYRGIFGSGVALVVRRLRRVLERYRSRPTFVLASATVSSPAEHASALVGLDVAAVTADGSPRGEVTFVLWEPPVVPGPDGTSHRRSATTEAADLTARLVEDGVQTLAFARSRAGADALSASAHRRLLDSGSTRRVAAYRGGYLPEDRRVLERDLRSGALTGLAATNALELGIDIHGLDAVVMAGWPGRLASLWQQAGRAGRARSASLAVLVGADDPLDTFVLGHPELIFEEPLEHTVICPENPHLLERHLCAAAYERPLTEADAAFFGESMGAVLDRLVAERVLRRRPGGWFWPEDRAPDEVGSLRTSGSVVTIAESLSGRIIGTVDSSSAHHQVHAGAVHVHQGDTYVVTELDLDLATARVVRGDPGWSTFAQSVAAFQLPGAESPDGRAVAERTVSPAEAVVTVDMGPVVIRSRVVSFLRRLPSGEVVGRHPLDLPEQVLHTEGVWWTVGDAALAGAGIDADAAPGALHAAEHAAIGLLPLFAGCDRWDIGGVSTACHPDTGRATVLVYDGYSGGAGFAARGHEVLREWLTATRALIHGCPCDTGCPRCIQSPKCGNGNQPLDKGGSVRLLDLVIPNLRPGRGA